MKYLLLLGTVGVAHADIINGVNCPVSVGEFGPCCPSGNVVIPEGVTSLAEEAFRDCRDITGVTFPSTLLEIKKDAFRVKDPITMVDLSVTGLTTIGDDAFKNVVITTLKLPSTLNSVAEEAFDDATITNVIYPEGKPSVSYIPDERNTAEPAATDTAEPVCGGCDADQLIEAYKALNQCS